VCLHKKADNAILIKKIAASKRKSTIIGAAIIVCPLEEIGFGTKGEQWS